MAEKSEANSHTLKKIRWTELAAKFDIEEQEIIRTEVLTAMTEGMPVKANEVVELRQQLADFISELISEIKRVLSIEDHIHVVIDTKDESVDNLELANFQRKDDTFILTLSSNFLHECLFYLKLIIAAKNKANSTNEDVYNKFVKTFSEELMKLLHVIAHELYHARQEQEPAYALKTKLNNLMRGFSISNQLPDSYHKDLGERSAEAFAIRYLKEKKKAVSEKKEQTLIDQILLISYTSASEERLGELKRKISN